MTIKGCTKVGLNLLIFTVHPMKPGATLMSAFLFNVALVLLACTAVIQFCAQAFALYANESAVYQIFGNQARAAAPSSRAPSLYFAQAGGGHVGKRK